MRDDQEFNKEFCALVEQFPCLYDKTHPDYCIRGPQQQVWAHIGEKLNESATDCTYRWKNIRHSYGKYRQKLQVGSGAKPVKEYYLANHLYFLDPFLKPRKKKCNVSKLPTKEETVNTINDDWNADNTHSDSEPGVCRSASPVLERIPKKSPPSPTRDYGYTKRKRSSDFNTHAFKNFEKSSMEETDSVDTRQPVDPDMAFLQSILPDMKIMNAKTKRKFKMEVLQLADRLLDP